MVNNNLTRGRKVNVYVLYLLLLLDGMCLPFNRLLCWLARSSVTASRVLVRGCHPCGVLHLFIYLFTESVEIVSIRPET